MTNLKETSDRTATAFTDNSNPLKQIGAIGPTYQPRQIITDLFAKIQSLSQLQFRSLTIDQIKGGILVIFGYLLSPFSWWNDLIFNLPLAYLCGYTCSHFQPNLFLPGMLMGYWLSNLLGLVLIQIGFQQMLTSTDSHRSRKKEFLMGLLSATAYTLIIVVLVQLKIIDTPTTISQGISIDLGTFIPVGTFIPGFN